MQARVGNIFVAKTEPLQRNGEEENYSRTTLFGGGINSMLPPSEDAEKYGYRNAT